MKIYKNPDGSNHATLYPSLFFGSLGLNLFFLLKTCISLNDFGGLCLASLLSSFIFYHVYIKRIKGIRYNYANLFITTTATPVLVALLLGINYFISSEIFHAKSSIKENIYLNDGACYILHPNRPDVCLHLYQLKAAPPLYKYSFIETKINRGILGFPVVKFHKFIE